MASGRCPFLGQSTAEVISSILRDQPARVYEENENVPEELDTILRRCLEKDPAKRWQSADELREALSQIAAEVTYTTSAARRSKPLSAGAAGAAAAAAQRRTKTLIAGAVAVAALALITFAVWKWSASRSGGGSGTADLAELGDVPSIAVLPLTSFSGEPEYFVDGITDALISSLARIRGLRVISRQSAMHYKGSTKLLPVIAKELGVDYIVEGSVARSGENVRLNAQVLRADPETTIWSDTFERKAAEVLALESTFATAIAGAINVQLSPTEQTRMVSTKSVDPAAYEAFLQGRLLGRKARRGESSARRRATSSARSRSTPAFASGLDRRSRRSSSGRATSSTSSAGETRPDRNRRARVPSSSIPTRPTRMRRSAIFTWRAGSGRKPNRRSGGRSSSSRARPRHISTTGGC